ncbi:MAG: hypothetical protein ACYC61_05335 [Isosphaeraceae bacterium]
MTRMRKRAAAVAAAVSLIGLGAAMAAASEPTASLKAGKPDIKSAGPLTFGPDGILFVGDTKGAAVFAIDTGDRAAVAAKKPVRVKDVAGKVAGMLGTDVRNVQINDLAVNPASGTVYLSVSRGRGPNALPVIVRINADGKLDELSLENVRFARAEVPNAPAPGAGTGTRQRGPDPRNESITDLAYVDGRLFLAGLSNEEFSSRLIAIPFPFSAEGIDGASIEIYHGAHGQLETRSPIRTFVAYRIDNQPYLLAAYTCTPLVKVPVADLKAGAHVMGKTIAELGNRNRPLDMIVYKKDGKDFILLANNSRGVMKIHADGAGSAEPITQHVPGGGTKGVAFDKVAELKGVVQLDQLDDRHAVILTSQGNATDLDTIELP